MKHVIFVLPLAAVCVLLAAFTNLHPVPTQQKTGIKYGARVTYTAIKDQSSWGCQTPKWDQEPYKIAVEGRTDCIWDNEKTAIIVARRDAKSNVPACYKLADPDSEGQINTWTCN